MGNQGVLAGFVRTVVADKAGKKGRKIARPKVLEKYVKKAILDYLQLKGVWAWNNPTGGAFIPFEKKGAEGGKPRGHFLQFGKKYSPDIIGVLPGGKFLGIEAKSSKEDGTNKERREGQAAFGAEITKRGGVYIRAKSVGDVMGVLGPILGGW